VTVDAAIVMPERDEVMHLGNLEIRPSEYQLLADGRRVGMTVREFETFHALAQRADRVVPRAEIYRVVWGGEMAHRDRSVDVFVRKVRRKLARAAPGWTYVHTHFGIGYRLSPERRAAGADPAGR
jgi:DNA-binding response OmpR family regulator